MSDDRFKQARRSLIDRNNQRQQQSWDDSFDDDFEDESTALVNMGPAFAPPPNFAEEDSFPDDGATEMIQLDAAFGIDPPAPQMRSHSGVQPSYDRFAQPQSGPPQSPQSGPPPSGPPQSGPPQSGHQSSSFGQPSWEQPSFGQPPSFEEQTGPLGSFDSGDHGFGNSFGDGTGEHTGPLSSNALGSQPLVIGAAESSSGFEENTAFINLNNFAAGGEHFTPDDHAAGYEGSTQFVNIAALQASGPAGSVPVEHDAILKQAYTFGAQSVQHNDVTLIFAQNQAGQPVVLKRVWEGDPNGMPIPVRQRIAALDQIRHPQLAGLNGMIAAPSGAWVELARPAGFRLTELLTQNGPTDPITALNWIEQIAQILTYIHSQAFVYANLTTDAVWIQDDGRVVLEPFDVLAYEMRGNLGPFGPPELNLPAEHQVRTPATDVYSLSAITIAVLTGLPLNLTAVERVDPAMQAGLIQALNPNANQRQGDAISFVNSLKQQSGGRAKSSSGGPDKKKLALIGVTAVALVAVLAVVLLPGGGDPPDEAGMAAPNSGEVAAAEIGDDGAGPSEAPEATATATPAVLGEGVETDPRLKVVLSYATNPPDTSDAVPTENDRARAATLREEARESVANLDSLQESVKRERYASALTKLANAARIAGGMTQADHELFEELSQNAYVTEIRKDYFDRVDSGLKEERISRVKQVYPQLAAVDAESSEVGFFVRNKAVSIKPIPPVAVPE